jgi:hypothetical protein
MRNPRHSSTEQIGVNAVEALFLKMGWIFRTQFVSDVGIDAQIELVENGEPTGKLIAIQIKSGRGNFKETRTGFRYSGSLAHYDYWLRHSLPVLLIAHLPDTDETYWINVSEETASKTPKGWGITIPKTNILNIKSKSEIEVLFRGTQREQRLRQLTLDEPIMRLLADKKHVVIEFEDWINKSLGRSEFVVSRISKSGKSYELTRFPVMYAGRLRSLDNLLAALFPWANTEVDEEFYEENADSQYDFVHQMWEDEPYQDSCEIYPYCEVGGEAELYRLKLSLNKLGESYLMLSNFLSDSTIKTL